jgi:hypothetical protein
MATSMEIISRWTGRRQPGRRPEGPSPHATRPQPHVSRLAAPSRRADLSTVLSSVGLAKEEARLPQLPPFLPQTPIRPPHETAACHRQTLPTHVGQSPSTSSPNCIFSALFSKEVFDYPLSQNHLQSHNPKPAQFLACRAEALGEGGLPVPPNRPWRLAATAPHARKRVKSWLCSGRPQAGTQLWVDGFRATPSFAARISPLVPPLSRDMSRVRPQQHPCKHWLVPLSRVQQGGRPPITFHVSRFTFHAPPHCHRKSTPLLLRFYTVFRFTFRDFIAPCQRRNDITGKPPV